ncbi:MAG: aquaporin family protein [Proteobacteria bacterium]|nr:aquaporin family protein [Pseudomonadota bacterium]
MEKIVLRKRIAAEFVGTMTLLAVVVGSGIMGETLSGGNIAIALLGNTLATGAILIVLIEIFGPLSGAHFNPAVTLSFLLRKKLNWYDGLFYFAAQLTGGLIGVLLAHLMFDQPLLMLSTKVRSGMGQWSAEFIATFGLVATILGCLKTKPGAVSYMVGLYISAGYWFTSSTSFANPAVTFARGFTETFSGIRLLDVPAFFIAQILGALVATAFISWIWQDQKKTVYVETTGLGDELNLKPET